MIRLSFYGVKKVARIDSMSPVCIGDIRTLSLYWPNITTCIKKHAIYEMIYLIWQ